MTDAVMGWRDWPVNVVGLAAEAVCCIDAVREDLGSDLLWINCGSQKTAVVDGDSSLEAEAIHDLVEKVRLACD